jgi:UDP-3-O-acyl-N-acetylglucosamine deacetylase
VSGIDFSNGNISKVYVRPADTDTGIVFETLKGEKIKAELQNTSNSLFWFAKTLTLEGEKENIASPEHLLAQLSYYGVDNAIVQITKEQSFSSSLLRHLPVGSGRNTYFVPHLGRKLCEGLDDNIKVQNKQRRILRLEEEINTEKLKIKPIEGDNVIITAITEYTLKTGLLKQKKELTMTPEVIKSISVARGYCNVPVWAPQWLTKFVSLFFFPTQGYGNGNNLSNVFYPQKTESKWRGQELIESEIACHTIMDRAAELSLLPGRIKGIYVDCKFAGHKDTIETLIKYQNCFKEIKK